MLARPAAPAVVFLAILVVIFGVSANGFFTFENFRGILASVAVLGVVAVGVNQVILAGDIDISVGSMLGLCAVAVGAVSTSVGGLILPLLAGMAVGAAIGAVNGSLSTYARIPSIIVTLGMLYALRGLTLVITGGDWVTGIPASDARARHRDDPRHSRSRSILLLGVAAAVAAAGRFTAWGRDIHAVGGNRSAARFAGLDVNCVRLRAFVLTGALVGLAATILVGRVGSVTTDTGVGLELQVIAAVVIGGTSIAGGRGSTLAALIGTILIGVFLNGLVLLDVPAGVAERGARRADPARGLDRRDPASRAGGLSDGPDPEPLARARAARRAGRADHRDGDRLLAVPDHRQPAQHLALLRRAGADRARHDAGDRDRRHRPVGRRVARARLRRHGLRLQHRACRCGSRSSSRC